MSHFVEHLHEVFRDFGLIRSRRMFGGHGIYHDGHMIGLVADDVLYLKADAQSRGAFDALDLPAFEYDKAGKTVSMSYYQAPESIYDDPDQAARWAQQAYAAAQRSKKQGRHA